MCEFDQRLRDLPGAAGFVDGLVTAIVNGRIYAPTHPRVRATITDLVRRLDGHFGPSNAVFALGCVHGYLIHEGRPLLAASLSAPRLIETLARLDAGGIEFLQGVNEQDVTALLEILGDRRNVPLHVADANQRLASLGSDKIRFVLREGLGEQLVGAGSPGDGETRIAPLASAIEAPVQLYQGIVDLMQTITVDACRGDHFSLDSAHTQIEKVLETLDSDPKTILNLARYEHYDAFTFGHSIRVSFLAMNFARSLTNDPVLLNRIGTAALLHDVGKARVPFEILQSRARLTMDERREMERHTVHGGELLLDLQESDPMAIAAAFGHHRTMDGKGYPRSVPEARQSSVTRIVKICDVYEALTAVRPYKAGMTPIRAYRVMLTMRNHFDLALLRHFIEVNGVYPVGTEVHLSNGQVARVEQQSADLLRPIVQLEIGEEGEPLHDKDRELIDLSLVEPAALCVERIGGVAPLLAEPVAV